MQPLGNVPTCATGSKPIASAATGFRRATIGMGYDETPASPALHQLTQPRLSS